MDRQRTPGTGPTSAAPLWAAVAVGAPLLLLALLRVRPELDVLWRNHPAHFWLVLVAAATAALLGHAVTEAARRRRDARLVLVSLAFVSAAGFLGLHALATPGVLVGPNAGFELATPVGLVIGAVLVAVSAFEIPTPVAERILVGSRALLGALLVVMAAWAAVSITGVPPLDAPLSDVGRRGWQASLAVLGVLGYGVGAVGYLRLYRQRGARLVLAFAVALGLLAVAMVVVALSVSWRLSWWQWHALILAAVAVIAVAARREWHQERFSPIYLERTLRGTGEASVLFADLAGFTPYSERHDAAAVQEMLRTYFARLVPLLQARGGDVHELIGDAVMVVFNKHGGQPDHALLAARAGLAFQEAAAQVADDHPDWPRFRVGINSGEVATGVLGERGHRKHDVIGDTVNLAARLESQAPVGAVVVGAGTYEALPEGTLVEALPPLQVKGKADPVTAYVLRDLPR
jgi:adenylate cyclase